MKVQGLCRYTGHGNPESDRNCELEIRDFCHQSSRRHYNNNNFTRGITRGLTVNELTNPQRWHQGPEFLYLPEDQWPTMPSVDPEPDDRELRKSTQICSARILPGPQLPAVEDFPSWKELLEATARSLHGAADDSQTTSQSCEASDYLAAEIALLAKSQLDSFPDDVKTLKSNRAIPSDSRLHSLSPE